MVIIFHILTHVQCRSLGAPVSFGTDDEWPIILMGLLQSTCTLSSIWLKP